MSKKNFFIDTLLNIIATAVPILTLQLIILPIVGARLGGEEYGLVVTLISLFTLVSFPFGNVLNNVRLLHNKIYEQKKLTGDFNILLLQSVIISCIMVIMGTVLFEETFTVLSMILMITVSGINLLREYIIVSFRITLNYKGILVNNLLLALGYIVGALIFNYTDTWQMIFLIGYGISLIYIIRNSSLLKEPFVKTELFKTTTYSSLILLISSILKNLLIYADKLLLYPLLGPKAVSIYYTATIIGKILTMVINPINGVVLSYITRVEKFGLKLFIKILLIMSVVGIFGYLMSILVGPYILKILYQNWAEESIKLLYVTSASAIIGVLSSVINPFILRFTNINFQIIINGLYVLMYIVCVLIFYKLYGLLGFSIGVLIASFLNLILMITIFIRYSRK